jgi:hypothetical protein
MSAAPGDVERVAREMAEAIWKANGGVPRLLHEIARYGSNLSQQQELCEKQAQACAAIAVNHIERERVIAVTMMREAAAHACEEQARLFLSPEYATGQPLSSFNERFACKECADAIRAIPLTTDPAL